MHFPESWLLHAPEVSFICLSRDTTFGHRSRGYYLVSPRSFTVTFQAPPGSGRGPRPCIFQDAGRAVASAFS